MAEQDTALEILKSMGDAVLNGIIELWFLITIGLLATLGFLGKRTLKRWDRVMQSHVPDSEIDKRFAKTYDDMTKCQQELKTEISAVKDGVSEVHGRIDDMMHYLMTGSSKRPARESERDDNE